MNDAMSNGANGSLGPILDAQFGEQGLEVRLHSVFADRQCGPDFPVAAAFDEQLKHFHLSLREFRALLAGGQALGHQRDLDAALLLQLLHLTLLHPQPGRHLPVRVIRLWLRQLLVLTNLDGTLGTNDTFKLFSATSYSGAFAGVSPAQPRPGLAWNTNTLPMDGTLRLVQTVDTTPTNITAVLSGSALTLSWPADHTGWRLQTQTNALTVGLGTNWVDVPGATATNQMSFTIDPANGSVFYRLIYP